jgi:hypothetical protein
MPGCCLIDSRNNVAEVLLDDGPAGRGQHDDRKTIMCEILLMLDVLIGRYQNLELLLFSSAQQLTVLKVFHPFSYTVVIE